MNIADMLNPSATADMLSPPLSPEQNIYTSVPLSPSSSSSSHSELIHGKPRSRFSNLEDAIICDGVAKGLTWGQISSQLPHRKRATCFNRYRTLQGVRKSRRRSQESRHSSSSCNVTAKPISVQHSPITTPTVLTPVLSPSSSSPSSSSSASSWTPTSPPCDLFLSSYPVYSSNNDDSLIRKLSIPSISSKDTLPPIYYPIPQHPKQNTHYHNYRQHLSQSTITHLPSLV
ncbi:unnamed protein product [Absidia cylindrospora]